MSRVNPAAKDQFPQLPLVHQVGAIKVGINGMIGALRGHTQLFRQFCCGIFHVSRYKFHTIPGNNQLSVMQCSIAATNMDVQFSIRTFSF
jgi:hypothetical protein